MILNRSFKAAIISIVLTYVLDFCNKQELRVLKVGKTKFFLGKGLSRHRPNADGAMEFDANYFFRYFLAITLRVNGCSSMAVISWRPKACLNLSLHAVIQIEIFVRQIHSNFK